MFPWSTEDLKKHKGVFPQPIRSPRSPRSPKILDQPRSSSIIFLIELLHEFFQIATRAYTTVNTIIHDLFKSSARSNPTNNQISTRSTRPIHEFYTISSRSSRPNSISSRSVPDHIRSSRIEVLNNS